MMRTALRIVVSIALVVDLTGCAWWRARGERDARKQPEQAVRPRLVGTIALVNVDERFVLIDNGSEFAPPSGAALKSFSGKTETGVLMAGSVRRRPFVIADIVKGTPQKGDQVFQ